MHDETVGRPMEILLVEDSLTHARLAIGALRKGQLDHRLTLVRDGQEALHFIRQEGIFARAPQPDLVLLDLYLPKMNGFEVLEELRSSVEMVALPVVVMTSSDDDADMERCRLLGVDHYIVKPVDFDKFLRVVRLMRVELRRDLVLPFVKADS